MRVRKHPGSGFTIVEVMITLAIIGFLASMAVSQYRDHVRRAGLTEAFSRLGDLRIKLEQFYQSNRNYGTNTCGNDGNSDTVDFSANATRFSVSCQLNGSTNQAYLLTATGSAITAGHVYTLDSSNSKRTLQFPGRPSTQLPAACWLVRGNEC